ncbi:MAG: response regulator [Candidatus Aminicenantes bacterium]|nr:response regulator [Candidatus Aminicenantes bacterium]NIM83720.1 response regulator [Candidatus Aminicenantes bacterium]NIN23145.1 response regulator [Candidatus Aminicenantes bacterium]NIN46872.1 response regulator [Candidatus Aminicenantes bacterium]NIN89794.1 response regulator [Candidatus Aminicenantes bacterium]
MPKANGKENILVVDDSIDTLEMLERNLKSKGYRVFTAQSVVEAIKILDVTQIDLVITDIKMPINSGFELIEHIKENFKYIEIVVITGFPSIEGAIRAVKNGAEEYLPKPFTDKELFTVVERALEKLQMRRTMRAQLQKIPSAPFGIIGKSESMRKIFEIVEKAAATSATVVITGESGTGKELVARAIHYSSARASAPFVPVHCGSIPESLLESELFGYLKGSFTGAFETRAGFFQTADGGTIFLDEISETSSAMQVKLLRVLQEKEICMVGSRRTQKVDVRILAATNKDLLGLVKAGLFREDLYYRLNVINIEIPPLRDRGEDILLLIRYFTTRFAEEAKKTGPQFSDHALEVLKNYNWPGNVRELENVIHRLVIMNEEDVIDVPDLPSLMRSSISPRPILNRTLAEVEAEHIRSVLASVNGNKTQAAKILGIDRKTLREKLKNVSNS